MARNWPMLLLVAAILLLVDFYAWQAVKVAFGSTSAGLQKAIKIIYWCFSLFGICLIVAVPVIPYTPKGRLVRTFFTTFVFIFFFAKFLVVILLMLEDVVRLLRFGISKLGKLMSKGEMQNVVETSADHLSRSEFLSKAALVAGTIPIVTFTTGIISGAHDYRVRRINLILPKLPSAFNGITIAQISDIHTGSFWNKTAVKGGVEMLMAEKPDVIFFTGDLVNDQAKEVAEYLPIFSKLKADLGVYSTLGNHDYGDYAWWPSAKAKAENLQDLIGAHKTMGYDILLDAHRYIKLGTDEISIIGIQNWGTGRFAKYGNLNKAMENLRETSVNLLLSHDPSHWEAQVVVQKPSIDVAFAGHTHGMQFGVEVGGFQWSPVQYRYKQWAGLYKNPNGQQLYVNRGFGYIGYPGRVGMPPEITIFTLKNA